MFAVDVMERNVVSVTEVSTVADAVHLMLERRISGLPVVDRTGRLCGMITEGDFLRRGETGTERKRPRWLEFILGPGRLAGEYAQTHTRKVGDVMTRDVMSAGPSTSLDELVKIMEEHHIKRVPIVVDGRPVGIVSRADLLRALANVLARDTRSISDADIRRNFVAEIEKYPWALGACSDAVVRNGAIELHGIINDERQRLALKIAAENTPGVREVIDRLVWIEPMSGIVVGPAEGSII